MLRILTFHDQPLQSHWLQQHGQHTGCVVLQQTANGLTLCFCCRLSTARRSLAEMPALQIRCFSTSQDSSSSWSCRNWKKLRESPSRPRRALLLSTRLQHKSRKTSDNDRQKVILRPSNLHLQQLLQTHFWYVLFKLSNQRCWRECTGSVWETWTQ
jgi:hypothetical protein